VPAFLAAWDTLRADAAAGRVATVAVVGGGASGVELLLAMQHRLAAELGEAAPRFALITDQPQLLADFPPGMRARFGALLVARGVVLHQNSGAIAVEPGTVITTHQRRIAVDRIVWATSAAAQAWPAACGLACDARGFIRIDRTLRSPSHPFVFATGDCAAQDGYSRPKSAAFAMRQGAPLAANLRHALRRESFASRVPPRQVLTLIGTGGRHAVASRGPLVVEGGWVWQWKDRIDRAYMAKFALPETVELATPPPDEA
jgi:selenide,water dikinase